MIPPEEEKITKHKIIIEPKEDRIKGGDDFSQLIKGNQILQKYNGVKQIAAKEKVAAKRVEERQKRTFSKLTVTFPNPPLACSRHWDHDNDGERREDVHPEQRPGIQAPNEPRQGLQEDAEGQDVSKVVTGCSTVRLGTMAADYENW